MASNFKPRGLSTYVIPYFGENGDRRKKVGATDNAVTERIARALENRVGLREEGLHDPRDEAYREHSARPRSDHFTAYEDHLAFKEATPKQIELSIGRARRIVALIQGAKLVEIDPPKNVKRSKTGRLRRDVGRLGRTGAFI